MNNTNIFRPNWIRASIPRRGFMMLAGLFWFGVLVSPAADLYVATNATGDGSGSSWTNAMGSIQGAIDAISGSYTTNTVWVSNGVYEVGGVTNYPTGTVLTNRVAIWKAITVRSAHNDPTNTIIKGAKDNGANGPASVRCVYMTNASSLIGFTLTNGSTFNLNYPVNGTNNDYHSGGGVFCPATITPIISNCLITGNSAAYNGGGIYYGTLLNCTLITNVATGSDGGGAYGAYIYNCGLYYNYAAHYGGGAYAGAPSNCTFVGNFTGYSGGAEIYATLYNCTIISNAAIGGGGGGTYACTMYNCLLTGNWANMGGGGTYGAGGYKIYNCTIVGNYSRTSGGGTVSNYLYNCIVYFNDAPIGSNYLDLVCITNSCTTPSPGIGEGNISDDPLLIDKGSGYGTNHVAGNYRLSKVSPCINTGTNLSWMIVPADVRSKDLDGHPRIDGFYGRVDMGAYEDLPSGAIFGGR